MVSPGPRLQAFTGLGVSRGFARLQSNYNQFRSGELHRATRPRLPRQHYNPVVHGLPWPSASRFHWSGVSRGLAPLRSIKLQSISVVSVPSCNLVFPGPFWLSALRFAIGSESLGVSFLLHRPGLPLGAKFPQHSARFSLTMRTPWPKKDVIDTPRNKWMTKAGKQKLRGRELNPGLPRDRRKY